MYDNYVNINDYNQENYELEESNYDFENSTIQSNSLSDVTLDKSLKNIKDKTIKDNDENVSLDEHVSSDKHFSSDENVSLDEHVSLDKQKINKNKNEKNEIILNNKNTNLKKNYDQNNEEDNNKSDLKNNNIEDKILLDNIENNNVENKVLDNIQENKQYLKKQRKKQRRKQKKIEERKKNQEKDNEELELINKAINSNKLELLEKIKKLNLDENQYDLIKNLSYAELNEKMSKPITYDMREKFKKIFEENKNLNLLKFIDNILEDDFNTLAKKNKELVDDMKIYLNQNKFNKFYFYSIYELMYNEKLKIFIIDNKQKTYDIQYPKIKYSYDLIFYEHINDKKINNFFSTYLDEI